MHPLYAQGFLFRNRKDGFTLIEVLLGIALLGIVILMVFSMIHFVSMTSDRIIGHDNYLLDGRFALGYIKSDIEEGMDLLPIESIPNITTNYKDNMGFVIRKYNSGSDKYQIILYTQNEDALTRHTFSSPLKTPPSFNSNEGYNNIIRNVDSISGCEFDEYNNVLVLSIAIKDKKSSKIYEFLETININNDF